MIKKKEKKPIQKTIEIDLTGPDGNAYVILGLAKKLCKEFGIDPKPLLDEMMSSDYENLIKVFDKNFGSIVTMYR